MVKFYTNNEYLENRKIFIKNISYFNEINKQNCLNSFVFLNLEHYVEIKQKNLEFEY
jgi:hypothetical protein